MSITHIQEVYNQDRQHPSLPLLIEQDAKATAFARELLRSQISELVTEANQMRVRKSALLAGSAFHIMQERRRISLWRTVGNLQVAFHRLKLRSQSRQLELF